MKPWLLAAAAVVALEPRAADACSCGNAYWLASPGDASTGVPTNAVIQIAFSSEPTVELRVAATGEVVPLEVEAHVGPIYAGWLLARPAHLAADTTYEAAVTMFEHGTYLSTFTTGSALHTTPPTVTLQAFAPQFLVNDTGMGNSCYLNELSRFALEGLETSAAGLVVLDVLDADRTTLLSALALDPTEHDGVTGQTCGANSPSFTPGVEYCARARVYDVAGAVATSELRCAVAIECDWISSGASYSPIAECVPPTTNGDPQVPISEATGCASIPSPALWLAVLPWLRRRRRLR